MKSILSLFTLLVFVSCTPYPYQLQTSTHPTTQAHMYEVTVLDADGNSLDSAKVTFKISDRDQSAKTITVLSSADGRATVSVTATRDPAYSYVTSFRTSCDYEVSRDGYFGSAGNLWAFGDETGLTFDFKRKDVVTLLRSVDYLSSRLLADTTLTELRDKIVSFVALIKLQSLLAESDLEPRSIDFKDFKGKRYLELGFKSTTTYNSLKLNKYDIGKRVFDETVRKILDPLNDHISEPDKFFGYDLRVIGYMKDFSEEYASKSPIEYHFMIPIEIVKQYKDKDISGQRVLDESILLMDNERIELKLQ